MIDRTRLLNNKPEGEGAVVYWMSRDQRVFSNRALSFAQQKALMLGVPLRVVFTLSPTFLGATRRQYDFMLKGLKVVETQLKKHAISLEVLLGDPAETMKKFVLKESISVLCTDFSPLSLHRTWRNQIADIAPISMIEIDAHNIVPPWIASPKKEFAAYTFRPKIYACIKDAFDDFPLVVNHPYAHSAPSLDWDLIQKSITVNEQVLPVSWCLPGEDEAKKALTVFLTEKLLHYGSTRNDPSKSGQSNLSPYLHFGHISAEYVAKEVSSFVGVCIEDLLHKHKNAAKEGDDPMTLEQSAGAFLEELIVRRELAENFCFYEKNYTSREAFPDWAKKSHDHSASDKRSYVYTREEFEKANTHDPIWNAAQMEMVSTGKMHGYMRMYWAKKILEWTAHVDEALAIAIYLNDTYELDGRDPNGYAGIMWSIGGVHDRAWFSRPIFGSIRYMNDQGLKRKFDVNQYIEKVKKDSGERLF